jgi:hypothetical protein
MVRGARFRSIEDMNLIRDCLAQVATAAASSVND